MKFDKNELKDFLKWQDPDFLPEAKTRAAGRSTYICPACENGSGKKGDGISWDKHARRWHCFSCGLHEDTIGLYKLANELEADAEAFEGIKRFYGVATDSEGVAHVKPEAFRKLKEQHDRAADLERERKDYTELYEAAGEHRAEAVAYLVSRGFRHAGDIAEQFRLGFLPDWSNEKAPAHKSKRLIIPITPSGYLARATETTIDKKYTKQKQGHGPWCYNFNAMLEAGEHKQPIWLVEGELDALSITDAGGQAVAIGSLAYVRGFLDFTRKMIQEKMLDPRALKILVALDNEEDPAKKDHIRSVARDIIKGLEGLEIKAIALDPLKAFGGWKDANECLQANRKHLEKQIKEVAATEAEREKAAKEEALETYRKGSAAAYIPEFIESIRSRDNSATPTGFKNLDKALDGGLHKGLHIIGAISSLGKTTFTMQMADNIAKAGQNVLIFSLEMGKEELISKSISRLTLEALLEAGKDTSRAKTYRDITLKRRYKYYDKEDIELIEETIETYRGYAGAIYIQEGLGNIGPEQIKEAVKKHIAITGEKPVVVIDYLQMLAPTDVRASDKQNTDKAVLELKRLSRDEGIAIFAVSSLNRSSYSEEISMAAFKESGAIEYGADVLLGMQLTAAGRAAKGKGGKGEQAPFDVNAEKAKPIRDIELIILKNRNGATGARINLNYYTFYNYFRERG